VSPVAVVKGCANRVHQWVEVKLGLIIDDENRLRHGQRQDGVRSRLRFIGGVHGQVSFGGILR
jgi:hypothetical protein